MQSDNQTVAGRKLERDKAIDRSVGLSSSTLPNPPSALRQAHCDPFTQAAIRAADNSNEVKLPQNIVGDWLGLGQRIFERATLRKYPLHFAALGLKVRRLLKWVNGINFMFSEGLVTDGSIRANI